MTARRLQSVQSLPAGRVAPSRPQRNPSQKPSPKTSAPKKKQKARSTAVIAPAPVRELRERPPYTSPLLLTVGEAAGLLRLSERKVYYLLADHALASMKIGRSTRIKRSVIDTYIALLEQASEQASA